MKELSECRVLLVDDAKANLDILVEALKSDHKLSLALNGEMALQIAQRTPPDLVLLDIVMPGLDGYEVCRRLRAMPETAEVPIMFLSSLEEVQNKTKGFEVGANDYLTKPFEMLEVKARVRSLLKAKAYADAVKEKIAYDLRIAREIQMGILPPGVAEITSGTQLEAHAILEPAQAVGGDLYDVLRTADGNLVFVMGDVSGKGIPAALFMAVTVTLVRAMAADSKTPEEILRRVSDSLVTQNPRNMFVTLLCGIYEPATGKLTYASAGHPAAVLVRNGRAELLPTDSGMAAGIMAGLAAQSQCVQLQSGDLVILYTDGVTEAFNAGDELFGDTRLLNALTCESRHNAAETTAALLRAVRDHAAGHPQSDDIAILTLKKK
ncbi:MAG TPA: fused response regulator/phosphatase [Verrucomicrobiae bacterium]|jgi:sigma-B regulation protein RsbU (phosphoserine phosphatase)